MSKHYNLARMTTATTGTGTITLGSAASGFLTFAAAGAANGDVLTYAIEDGTNREVGIGTYTASGTTLARTTILSSTNGGAAISLSGSAQVFSAISAQDLALGALSDVNAAVTPTAGMRLSYGSTVNVVQRAFSAFVVSSPTVLLLPAVPTVGNILVLIISGYSSGSCTGFTSVYASGSTYTSQCTVLTRTVASGDGASWSITGGSATTPCQILLLEVSGTFSTSVSEFTPTVSGTSYAQTITVTNNALSFGFYNNLTTSTATVNYAAGANLLSSGSSGVAQLLTTQFVTTGTVTISLSAAPTTPTAFLVQFVGTQQWNPGFDNDRPWYWQPPPLAPFTTFVGTVAPTLISDPHQGLIVYGGTPVTGDATRAALRTLPADGTDFVCTAHIKVRGPNVNYSGGGLVVYDAIGASKCIIFKTDLQAAATYTDVGEFNLPTGFYFTIGTVTTISTPVEWFRITRTGTALNWMYSWDGISWITLSAAVETSWLSNAPSHIGLGIWYNQANAPTQLVCDYWSQSWTP